MMICVLCVFFNVGGCVVVLVLFGVDVIDYFINILIL